MPRPWAVPCARALVVLLTPPKASWCPKFFLPPRLLPPSLAAKHSLANAPLADPRPRPPRADAPTKQHNPSPLPPEPSFERHPLQQHLEPGHALRNSSPGAPGRYRLVPANSAPWLLFLGRWR